MFEKFDFDDLKSISASLAEAIVSIAKTQRNVPALDFPGLVEERARLERLHQATLTELDRRQVIEHSTGQKYYPDAIRG